MSGNILIVSGLFLFDPSQNHIIYPFQYEETEAWEVKYLAKYECVRAKI